MNPLSFFRRLAANALGAPLVLSGLAVPAASTVPAVLAAPPASLAPASLAHVEQGSLLVRGEGDGQLRSAPPR